MSRRPRRAVTAVCALVLLFAGTAAAGEVLQLTDGALVPGRVVALDGDGVTFAREAGGEMRVSWERVLPLSRYELWDSALSPEDAAGRVDLARWCLEAGLHRQARRELVRAQGLGWSGALDLDALVALAERGEADAALAEVDALVEAGRTQEALDRVKVFLRGAVPGAEAERVRERVPDLLSRIERQEALAREQAEELRLAEKAGRLQEWTERTMRSADASRESASEHAVQGFTQLARGNQTRARDALARAEKAYQAARRAYDRVRQTLRTGAAAELAAERSRECDARTVEVLAQWGRLEVDNKSYRKASAIVDRGLLVDPVDRELLELRRTIDENWIRRRLSDITNARGRTTNY